MRNSAYVIMVCIALLAALPTLSNAVQVGGCYGPTSGFAAGGCFFTNVDIVYTSYTSSAGFGTVLPVALPAGLPSPTPVIKTVLSDNQQNGQTLITCPQSPNPQNSMEYFSTDSSGYIAGNRCLADLPLMATPITLTTTVIWLPFWHAVASSSYNIGLLGYGTISNLAYSGETNNQGSSQYNISSGYNTQSYIFGQVPASSQSDLWTWTVQYADLGKADLSQLSVSKSFTGLSFVIPLVCTYTYNYQFHSYIQSINNAYIQVPQYNSIALKDKDWLNFSNYLYSPVESKGSTNCHAQLLQGFDCGGWRRLSGNSSLDVGGKVYRGVNVYYGTKAVSTDPSADYPQSLLAVYSGGYGEVNALSMDFMDVNALPVITDSVVMPTTYTPLNGKPYYLNYSFNVYSIHNYMTPSNSLDGMSIFQPEGFFASYNGFLAEFPFNSVSITAPEPNSLASPQRSFLSTLNYKQAVAAKFGYNKTYQTRTFLGPLDYGMVKNPAFIAASPNGYVYVINYSDVNCWYCLSDTATANLFQFRFMPQGYFNMSTNPPNKMGFAGGPKPWNYNWDTYAADASLEGSQSLYLTGVWVLSKNKNWWVWPGGLSWQGGALKKFIPLAVQADDNGDLFLIGTGKSGGLKLAGLIPPGGKSYVANYTGDMPKDFVASDEFAVSPGGQFVYAANASWDQGINVYSTHISGSSGGGVTKNTFTYSGNIPLSYSNSTYNMNIAAYLAAGGPYHDPAVAAAYTALKSKPVPDTHYYHHPVSIIDSKGILYVIDNWSFDVDGYRSSILMLRAFSQNGTELQINPTMINTMYPSNPAAASTPAPSLGSITPSNGWEPYGWPLAANISLPNYKSVSYCEYDCTKGPNSFNSAYPPIGPKIDEFGGQVGKGTNSLVISSDFNGTLYLIAHPWSFSYGNPGCITAACPVDPLYTELLVLRPNIQNYTKIAFAGNSTYMCYLNKTPTSISTCTYNQQTAAVLSHIYPPILGVPSSFNYVEGLGGPEQYLNLQNALSSSFPTGADGNSYKSSVNKEVNNGFSGGPNYNALATGPFPTSQATAANVPASFIKSTVGGYAIVPYTINVVLQQKWTYTSEVPINPFLIPICWPFPKQDINEVKQFQYKTINLGSSTLNQTIEGGSPYLQYLPSQLNYVQNLSDSGAIISPYVNFQDFTARLFGEIYVNQTISPKSAIASSATALFPGLPATVNAVRTLDYWPEQYLQVSRFGKAYAYDTQENVNTFVVGANCGVTCLVPNYYYSPLSGLQNNYNSAFSYTNINVTQFFQLFELFKYNSHIGNIVLNLTGDKGVYGYNRFIYTFVDRFNNTIYMPLDVDLANITQLSMNYSTLIDPSNENQTAVTVQGSAYYNTPSGTKPVKGGSIYLYWDTNINYYNTIVTPSSNPSQYYDYALRCALAPEIACNLSNPLSTLTQKQPAGALEADLPSYHPDYGPSGSCQTQPTSLLQPTVYNCNLFGNYGLKSVSQGINGYQYCMPYFPNGTGIFTSQLGLIGIAKTDSNGNFKYTFNACGVGQDRVVAQYYGNAAPEPIIVQQTPLTLSGGVNEFGTNINPANTVKTQEYNYNNAPNVTTTEFEIGAYGISLKYTYVFIPVIIIVILILAARGSLGSDFFALFGISTLINSAGGLWGQSGVGRGLTARTKTGKAVGKKYGADSKATGKAATGIYKSYKGWTAGNVAIKKEMLRKMSTSQIRTLLYSKGLARDQARAMGRNELIEFAAANIGMVAMSSYYEKKVKPRIPPGDMPPLPSPYSKGQVRMSVKDFYKAYYGSRSKNTRKPNAPAGGSAPAQPKKPLEETEQGAPITPKQASSTSKMLSTATEKNITDMLKYYGLTAPPSSNRDDLINFASAHLTPEQISKYLEGVGGFQS